MESESGRIVVGYDGSPPSVAALDWAAVEAERRHLPLTVLYVVDRYVTDPRGQVEGTPESTGLPGLAARRRVRAGRVVAEAVRRARKTAGSIDITAMTHVARVASTLIRSSRRSALLVVGTRGAGDVAAAHLGSVGFALSAHAQCPVVVVRGDSSQPPGPDRPVAVGVDGSIGAEAALEYAAQVAATASADLIIIVAGRSSVPVGGDEAAASTPASTPTPAGGPILETMSGRDAQAAMASAVRVTTRLYPDLPVHERVVPGPALEALTAAAAGCGLLVVGARGAGGVAGLMLGSVSHAVIHSAPCPVAVVRGGRNLADPRHLGYPEGLRESLEPGPRLPITQA